jgi:chitin deacetylase
VLSPGPKSPGLIILEHELGVITAQIFIENYPLMLQNGWNLQTVSELGPTGSAWQNAVNPVNGTVDVKDILISEAPTSTSTTTTRLVYKNPSTSKADV